MDSGNNKDASKENQQNFNKEYDRQIAEQERRDANYEKHQEEIKASDARLAEWAAEREQQTPESFMSKFIRPVIEVFTKYIMENYLTEDNINAVSNLMQSIVEEFFERLDDIANHNPRIAASVSQLKAMVAKAISKEARRTVVPEGGSKRRGKRRQTKKRRGSKRRKC